VPFRLATVLGASLLFLIQPLLARQILPWFGGGSAVWSAALLFFQLGLVGGYAYAHLTRRLGPRRQATLHAALLVIALLFVPLSPGDGWKPPDGDALVGRVLWLLTANAGWPYVLLAATAPLIQDWFARSRGPQPESIGAERPAPPYRLYVLSNAGSLSALLAYPLLMEPNLPLSRQHLVWSALFVVFVGSVFWCAARVRRLPATGETSLDIAQPAALDVAAATPAIDPALWVLLPAIGSGLLLATTTTLTQDVAAVPLLWIVPLALYLVTFILAFAGWYWRPIWSLVYLAMLAAVTYAFREDVSAPAALQGLALVGSCFAGAMVCHGELVRVRPPVARLTAFYLAIAVGGSLGGAFVAIGAPLLFTSTIELPILHVLAMATLAGLAARSLGGRSGILARMLAPPAVVAALIVAGSGVLRPERSDATRVVEVDRGFYGVVRVTDEPGQGIRRLYHGRILHGLQFTTPTLTTLATTYYVEGSGIELAIRQHPKRLSGQPMTIGVVGLGTGSVAAWGVAGDLVRFFEIDPVITALSARHFSFARESKADVAVVPGDARLSLEREMVDPVRRGAYDVIALDAFTGDAIPVHLLTDEAFGLYDQALAPDGILAVHVSNRYLDLRPVVRGLASRRGLEAIEIFRPAELRAGAAGSTWMLVSRNAGFIEALRPQAVDPAPEEAPVVWTDDFSSLLAVWKPR
jgi:spermidine synthase